MNQAAKAAYWREQADKCLLLSRNIADPDAIAELRKLAGNYHTLAEWSERERGDGVERARMEPPLE